MSLRAGAWLAARELRARWPRMLLAAGVIAVLAGAAVTMEVLARAREQAVADRIDAMGPPLTIVPAGTTAEALGRNDLGAAVLPPAAQDEIRAALGGSLRRLEARLVLAVDVGGRRVPLVGLPPEAWPADLPATVAVAGSALDHVTPVSASIPLAGEAVTVARIAEETGSADDAALFVPLAVAQRAAARGPAASPASAPPVNELRVYLSAGVAAEAAEAALRGAVGGAVAIRHDRGTVAGHEAQDSLAAHRAAAYAMLAGVALLCLLIAAHLDASERRLELATLVALGAPTSGVLAALVLRSAATGAAGALLGTGAGIAVAAAQDPTVASAWIAWLPVGASALAAAVAVAVVASGVVGIASVLRDPVRDLQEA